MELEIQAQEQNKGIQEIVRTTLCEHYELDCPEQNKRKRQDAWTSATTIHLNMWPELHKAIKEDAAETGKSMQALILQALEDRYLREEKVA